MRRIDAIAISFGVFVAGGIIFLFFNFVGLDSISAGIWSQVVLIAGVIGWSMTYLFRVLTKNMTYNQQLKDYEEAVIQKRFEEMSPEELAKLQEEVGQEKQS
ncbi:Protein of unknown function (DUF3007) [Xenococcus sp. PCC 7305]|uniref:DUF3007 family protein n=1 Tax=Xenococcus sp. PCC 7305 TaxID=102125 RepID=UPI0002ABEDDC|nr:DUF3007 family protein [Xenococcus sp. PCC 7305]ELS02756.1 Protein of unknown function (DUF3007) [Xenococcus sp. PCC 7305]